MLLCTQKSSALYFQSVSGHQTLMGFLELWMLYPLFSRHFGRLSRCSASSVQVAAPRFRQTCCALMVQRGGTKLSRFASVKCEPRLFTASDSGLQFLLQITGLVLPPLGPLGHRGYVPCFASPAGSPPDGQRYFFPRQSKLYSQSHHEKFHHLRWICE